MNEHPIPWGKLEMPDQHRSIELPLGLSLNIERKGNEILITRFSEGEPVLYRFITGTESSLYLEPGLPDLPMTLKPQMSLSILPGKKLEAIVEVPLVVKILTGSSSKKVQLLEFPLNSLSRSFFGNPDSGEISYFLESPLYKSTEEYEKRDSSVYCQVTISNRSVQNLEFERMILRVPYLSLYYGKKHLYGSPVVVTFRGQEQISQIVHKKSAPSCEPELQFASPPRLSEDNGLFKRSFFFIKTLYTG